MEDKIQIANQVAEYLGQLPWVKEAYVDDYNRNGSFQIVVQYQFKKAFRGFFPEDKKHFSLNRISRLMRSYLKKNREVAIIESISHPERMYSYAYGQKSFEGYDRNYTMVDVLIIPCNEDKMLRKGNHPELYN